MVDRRHIVRQWREGTGDVLVTLVRAEGSSYRRPGAHLLISANGTCAGTISGGCLEAEVVRKALWMVRNGAVVERYSTLFDDTAEIPFGLGCGGIVDLLFEPINTPECRAYLEAMEASLTGTESNVTTWLPEGGSKLARSIYSGIAPAFASETLTNADIASTKALENVYHETISPPQRLFVLGAGDDAKPVVTMAAQLGWRITVADARPQLARPDRFPQAETAIAANSVIPLNIGASDAVVIMTHSYEQDRAFLTGLLAQPNPIYLGLLGARHRSSLLVSEAAATLGCTVAECCERVFAPVGLDLGGEGPEAIALAVIAEVQACVQGKLGASRRLTEEDIASHISQGGASRYLQTQCAMDTPEPVRPEPVRQ
jgi:xanthine dehydrogenase accessory factor